MKGYAPFDWAVNPSNYMNQSSGVRVCYESLSPSYLRVMYDDNQSAVTLIDYPKYDQIDKVHEKDNEAKEQAYYESYGDYTAEQNKFKSEWDTFIAAKPAPSSEELQNWYQEQEDNNIYGPWISKNYVAKTTWNGGKQPDPYFDIFEYSILNNYENPDPLREWKRDLNATELAWIQNTLQITVPEAVTSIDVKTFIKDDKRVNSGNIPRYFPEKTSDIYKMYAENDDSEEVVGGLFSGKYEEKCDAEKVIKGNDYVQSITLLGVTSLPDYAFDSCESLQTVSIGDACKELGKAPFRGCTSLSSMSGNDKYFSSNGILYEKPNDGTLKIKEVFASRGIAVGQQVVNSTTDPDITSVTEIEDGAFQNCDAITG